MEIGDIISDPETGIAYPATESDVAIFKLVGERVSPLRCKPVLQSTRSLMDQRSRFEEAFFQGEKVKREVVDLVLLNEACTDTITVRCYDEFTG